MKERGKRDERSGGNKETPVSCFPTGGQGATLFRDCDLRRKVCVCAVADRVQNRCDQQVFPPQELAVDAPSVAVRVEPAGEQRHRSAVALHHVTS